MSVLRLLVGPALGVLLALVAGRGRLPRAVDDWYGIVLVFGLPAVIGIIYGLAHAGRPAAGWLSAAVSPWPSSLLLIAAVVLVGTGPSYLLATGIVLTVASAGALAAFLLSRRSSRLS